MKVVSWKPVEEKEVEDRNARSRNGIHLELTFSFFTLCIQLQV